MKLIILMFICLVATDTFANDDSSSIKDGVKSITSALTSSAKDALSGIKEGIDDGRISGTSIDGAIIIYDKEILNEYLDINILSSELVGSNSVLMNVAIKNKSRSVVRLINLNDKNNIFILDDNGFVAYLENIQSDISIPRKSASRVRFEFNNVEGNPAFLRLYGWDIKIPNQ